jgi:hypothetical protein
MTYPNNLCAVQLVPLSLPCVTHLVAIVDADIANGRGACCMLVVLGFFHYISVIFYSFVGLID